MKLVKGIILLALVSIYGCGTAFIRNKEAREDAAKMQTALDAQAEVLSTLYATAETVPVDAIKVDDDAADDPAIWYNRKQSSESKIYGSNKTAGIHTYDLTGKELQFVTCGRINNVDIRQNVDLGNGPVDIIVGSNRTGNLLTMFLIDDEGLIVESSRTDLSLGKRFEPYGFCMYVGKNNTLYAFVNAKTGQIDQYKIGQMSNGYFTGQKVRTLKLNTQVEGMVADDAQRTLYVGEEENAIFRFGAEPTDSTTPILLAESSALNSKVEYDIEGLTLLTSKYLIASIQGSFSYAIFDLDADSYVTSFKIKSNVVDGVEETDGIDINILPMGAQYPRGIMVVQDGFNTNDNGDLENQNFKIIDLVELYKLLNFPAD